MVCKLEEMNCIDIAYAGHILTDYSNEIQKRIMNMKSTKYKDLLKVANRCGCNIDLTTGMIS